MEAGLAGGASTTSMAPRLCYAGWKRSARRTRRPARPSCRNSLEACGTRPGSLGIFLVGGPERAQGHLEGVQAAADDLGLLRAGAAHIRSTPGLPTLFTVAAVFFLGNAALTALLVPYIGTVLHAAAGTLGWLFAALGAGYLAGAPLSRVVTARFPPRTIAIGSLAALGAVFANTFNTHDSAWDLFLFTLIGPPAVCFLITVDTFIARQTAPSHGLLLASAASIRCLRPSSNPEH